MLPVNPRRRPQGADTGGHGRTRADMGLIQIVREWPSGDAYSPDGMWGGIDGSARSAIPRGRGTVWRMVVCGADGASPSR